MTMCYNKCKKAAGKEDYMREPYSEELKKQIADLCDRYQIEELFQGGTWKEYDVLLPADDQTGYLTHPFVVLVGENEARITTPEETPVCLRHLQKEHEGEELIRNLRDILRRADEHTATIIEDDIFYEVDGETHLCAERHCSEWIDKIISCPHFECETENMRLIVKLKAEKTITKEEWLFHYVEKNGFTKEEFLNIVNAESQGKLAEIYETLAEERKQILSDVLHTYYAVFSENE